MNEILYCANPAADGGCEGNSSGLWVGNSNSALEGDFSIIKENNIYGILNVALDNDDAAYSESGYALNFSKVGLCDTGPYPGSSCKNSPKTLILAVQAIDQLMAESSSLQDRRVLVHCWSGGSRSVTIAALWIAQRREYTPTSGQTRFMTAINMVRKCRGLGFGTNHTYVPYDPKHPDKNGNGPRYSDGKPMAAVFDLAQKIDIDHPDITVGTGTPPGPNEEGNCPKSPR